MNHVPRQHGTHVAGIALGNGQTTGSHKGVAYNADIIFVALALSNPGDVTSSDWIVQAIKYVFEKANEDTRKPSAVVNLSVGWNGGRHDGESVVERAIDRFLEQEGRALVKSAGNEPFWKTHAAGKVPRRESHTLTWVFGDPDRTPNELEVWYSSRDRFQVRVGDPNGDWSDPVVPGENLTTTQLADPVYIESERFHILTGQARILVRVGVPNTTLTPGEWKIELMGVEVTDGDFDAWIELDTRDPGNNNQDQSWFRFPDPDKTITPPGTIRRGIAVANYDHRSTPQAPDKNSSRGPTTDARPKPELAAPGTNIAAGAGRQQLSGTSMSAPHVSGIVAQLFEHNGSLSAPQIKALLIASARRPGNLGPTPFDSEWGYGAVDAEQALRLIP